MYCGVDGFTTHQMYNTDSKFKPRSSWRHDAGSLHQGRHQAGDERAEPSWLSRCWTREQTWNDSVILVCQKNYLNTWEGIWTFLLHWQSQYFWRHQLYVANTPLEYVGLTPLDALVLKILKFYKSIRCTTSYPSGWSKQYHFPNFSHNLRKCIVSEPQTLASALWRNAGDCNARKVLSCLFF